MTLPSPNEDISRPKIDIKPIHIIGVIIGVILLIYFWYIIAPLFAVILIWKKTNLEKRRKWHATLAASVIMIILTSLMYYLNRPPLIRITEPADNITVYEKTVEIKGAVLPEKAEIEINDQKIETDNGNFSYLLTPSEGKNTVKITAKTWFEKEVLLTINRELTEEEIVKKEKAEAEAKAKAEKMAEERKKEAAAEAAKAKAEQEAWERSEAGQMCKSHPKWTKEECEKLANNKIWVGMTYEMLVYRWGKPDHKNLSNYGRGAEYQYCWDNYTPSCFYDNNDDGIIDAYN
jgi:uncharacterized protein YdaU (DUF1376 family)